MVLGGRKWRKRKRCGPGRRDDKERAVERARARAGSRKSRKDDTDARKKQKWEEDGGAVRRAVLGSRSIGRQ
eukprot:6852262-Prymnesium_polylepis.1